MKILGLRMSSIKEAADNLPVGLCYFDNRDILRLCNKQMYRFGFLMVGRELQSKEKIDAILDDPEATGDFVRDGDVFLLQDGSAWTLQKKYLMDHGGKMWTEYLALKVSKLYGKKQELEKRNEEQRKMMERLRHIAENVMTITREEEILSMKMKIHNDLGVSLQAARRFFLQGCPIQEKEVFVKEQQKMARILKGEVGNDDEVDVFSELNRICEQLGMKVSVEGILPTEEKVRNLITMAVRECLTNTIRHAGGKEVCVKIVGGTDSYTVEITNDGTPPKKEIVEGGGFSSLREKVEQSGGKMELVSLPAFQLRIILYKVPKANENGLMSQAKGEER